MSGGSLDYAYRDVDHVIELLNGVVKDEAVPSKKKLYKDFVEHLELVSAALHNFEMVLSMDYADGDEVESIEEVLKRKKQND